MLPERRRRCCCLGLGLLLFLVLGCVVWLLVAHRRWQVACPGPHGYRHGAVAADSPECSTIASDILRKGGSAVDGAIAALICDSLMNPQSMGIGGGAIFTLYNATTGKVTVINAREVVPQNVKKNLLSECHPNFQLQPGVQWIAVPGELRGYQLAHRLHGKLPWKSLFQPSISLARGGFPVPPFLSRVLSYMFQRFPAIRNTSVCSVMCQDGEPVKEGQILKLPALADTLSAIAEHGADIFYQGTIAEKLVTDIQAAGGALTAEDLKSYSEADQVEPLSVSLGDYQLFTPPPPSGGAIVSLILNILKGYGFSPDSLSDSEKVRTYHRVIEALKFGNGQQFTVQDPAFHSNMNEVTRLLTDGFAVETRQRILNESRGPQYYSQSRPRPDSQGTAHITVMDANGNGVSVTSSINHPFGSMFVSKTTGVILNNQLADFCLGASPQPGERPPSSMTPSVLTAGGGRSVILVGASGGSKIISAITQVLMNKLWLGMDLETAIQAERFHVKPSCTVQFEKGFNKTIIDRLRSEKLHNISDPDLITPVVQGIFRNQDCIQAVSDSRKMGRSAGY